jgi:hypothetical protein
LGHLQLHHKRKMELSYIVAPIFDQQLPEPWIGNQNESI